MNILNFIIWSVNPEIFPNFDLLPVRWYGLLFALAFIMGQQIFYYIYKKESRPEKDVDVLTLFILVATILGARLGHVFFYEAASYMRHPLSILYIWEGGLASHGAAFGIILGVILYSNYSINLWPFNFKWKRMKRENQDFFWVIDRIVIIVALAGCFIRFGNFVNSEIIGKPTGTSSGVVFGAPFKKAIESVKYVDNVNFYKSDDTKVDEDGYVMVEMHLDFHRGQTTENIDRFINSTIRNSLLLDDYATDYFYQPVEEKMKYRIENTNNVNPWAVVYLRAIPRHPTQLYESASSLLIFVILFLIWYKKREKLPRGLLFGLFLVILFGFRFIHEMIKVNQVAFEDGMQFNMGQILSIPLVLAGIVILLSLKKLQPKKEEKE